MGLDSAAIAEEGGDDEEEEASSPRYGFCGVRIAGASFFEGRVQVHTAGSTTVGLRRAWTITGGRPSCTVQISESRKNIIFLGIDL